MNTEMNRRQFLGGALAGGAAVSLGLASAARAQSPNNQIVVGVMGLSRGARLARQFAEEPNCVVKYVCDVDRRRADECAAAVAEVTDSSPEPLQDFRRMYDDPEVDAVAMALPVHWHAPAAILALKAGKHVYVEKPCCHNPREGELLVEAARKYGKAVQMGNQRRSWPAVREAMQRLHEGEIGNVYYSRCWYADTRGSIGRGQDFELLEHIDYDLWQGPAPRRPLKDNIVHYNWHWFWHWGSGESGNSAPHTIDLCRWGLNVDYPVRAASVGGRYVFDDDQETPDTHVITFDFPGGKTITWEGVSCNRLGIDGARLGAAFMGDEGALVIDDNHNGGYAIHDLQGREIERVDGVQGDQPHIADFLDAIRNDAPLDLNSEIEEGYKTTLLPLLGNIAHRTGRSLTCGEQGRIVGDAEAEALWSREYEPGWAPEV